MRARGPACAAGRSTGDMTVEPRVDFEGADRLVVALS